MGRLTDSLYALYYGVKLFPFRGERQERRAGSQQKGFVGIQIDGLSYPHLQQALDRGYLPHLERYLRRGHKLIEYRAGLPSTTPAAQSTIFYGVDRKIPAFRWFEKATGQVITCNDPDHVQLFRERLFANRSGVLATGSSYCNIIDGGAERSVFTVSSPHPQTLFGRLGGLRFVLLMLLNPFRVCRMGFATLMEFYVNRKDEFYHRRRKRWRTSEGLFPLIRILCNVVLRELQTFGVIADIYSGVPRIYTTYSGYDELAHHFGPGSWPALKNLIYTDRRIGEIIRAAEHIAGVDYQLVILSDHGQTPGYPFEKRFGATLGDAVSAFLRENQAATVSSGSLEFTRIQLGYLQGELEARRSWRRKIYNWAKKMLQERIQDLVPETLKIDLEGGVVITYSSTLAHLYITGDTRRLTWREVDRAQPQLLRFLQEHPGIGFALARGDQPDEICLIHRDGMLSITPPQSFPQEEIAFLRPYGVPEDLLDELHGYAQGEHCGDLILFGALDEEGIACFDDQVGGHGSVGGEQSRPFLILPLGHPVLDRDKPAGYHFLYADVLKARAGEPPPAEPPTDPPAPTGGDATLILHD
ncbi:MAG: alkaline phosphatase family protein [Desulfuromonadales bacterium]|nr:alkaline phosphatase family protein [Desulfuromonadales bacterium]